MGSLKGVFYQYKGGNKGVTSPPPAKGIKRFFFLVYTHFWRLIGLNLLFILFCLPVVTIPPAITALNNVLIALAREGNVFYFRDFIDEFKSSLIKSWIAFLPWLAMIAIAVIGYMSMDNVYGSVVPIVLFITVCTLLFCYTNYCFAMIALIDLPLGSIIRNAAIMVVIEMRRNVLMILTTPIFIVSVIFYMYSAPFILLFEFSFMGLVNVMIANGAIEKNVIQPKLESEAQ